MEEERELDSRERQQLETRHAELVKIIQSFERLEKSEEWSTLNELVFSKSVSSLERQLLNETLNPIVDMNKIYRLQGEWTWAKRYSDVNRYITTLKQQLADIKKKL